jgi:hypothetical protein
VQTRAPSAIAAWFQSRWRTSGSSSCASKLSRAATRRTFVSTTATRSPNANDATAAAV